ncbi:MAG: YebC/PmpR family DNA-binding transcriptional regulator [Gammaproteobacteria bacterium]
MAGHSKWANIQHRKGRQDAKRGKLFTKLIREITVAARTGGADVDSNPQLRLAIDKAKAQSMPKDNIDRAIKRGTGDIEGASYEDVRYEGYGPGGVAVMVDCVTDNRNRTVAEIRHAFTKHGGNLGADGSVGYLFNHVGLISFAAGSDEEKIMEAALEAGAEDVVTNDDTSIDVLTDPADFELVRKQLMDLQPENAEVTMHASNSTVLDVADNAARMVRLLETLEDLDDVQQVYSNADIPEALLENIDCV